MSEMSNMNKMWAVHVSGPDDMHACPDKEVADAIALLLNRQFRQFAQPMRAEVVEWQHGYEAWKAESERLLFIARPIMAAGGGKDLTQCDMHDDESR